MTNTTTTNLTIRYYTKNVYGNELMYPVDHEQAIYVLTGKKTITTQTMKGLQLLGFTFERVLEGVVR